MADTTYVDGQQPLIYAAWLNDINNVAYRVLGSGGAVPTTVAQLLANLGLTGTITVGGNNSFTGTNSFAGPTTFTNTVTHEATETFNVGSVLDILGSLNVSGAAGFTGSVALGSGATATTPAVGDNSTKVANTAFVEQYPALINNTSASSDISLAVGQGCYIDVAGATTVPLHVATGDNQLYEISIMADLAPSSTSTFLLPNNSTYTTQIFSSEVYGQGSSAATSQSRGSSFYLSNGQLYAGKFTVSTKTAHKFLVGVSNGIQSASALYTSTVTGNFLQTATYAWDTTTPWVSLGTLVFAVATSGRAVIRRTA